MLTLLGAGQGQNSSFDADYQAVLNKANALGYTLPPYTQQIKQNNLVLALKAGGIWNKLDVFYVFAYDSSSGVDFGRINWKNPNSYLATLINPLTFTSNQGLQGDGLTAYIDTTFNPTIGTNNYQATNASRYVYLYSATVGQTGQLDGNDTVNNNNIQRSGSTGNNRINQGTTTISPTFGYTGTKGMKSIHRTSNTDLTLFNSTTSATATNTGSASLPNLSQYILRSGGSYSAHNRISMYSMGASLIAENTAYVTAFENYINSL
jgi:hypothetical protein